MPKVLERIATAIAPETMLRQKRAEKCARLQELLDLRAQMENIRKTIAARIGCHPNTVSTSWLRWGEADLAYQLDPESIELVKKLRQCEVAITETQQIRDWLVAPANLPAQFLDAHEQLRGKLMGRSQAEWELGERVSRAERRLNSVHTRKQTHVENDPKDRSGQKKVFKSEIAAAEAAVSAANSDVDTYRRETRRINAESSKLWERVYEEWPVPEQEVV